MVIGWRKGSNPMSSGRAGSGSSGARSEASSAPRPFDEPAVRGGGGGTGVVAGNAVWMLDIIKTGMIGFGVASLYQWMKGTASERGILYELDPQPEAFELDPTLSALFHKLAKYRELQPEAYRRALLSADQLLLMIRNISANRRATDADYPLAETFIQASLAYLCMLRNRATDGPTRAAINILKGEIGECLKDQRLVLRQLCATTRI